MIIVDGFVNFLNVDALLKFAKSRLGTRWNLYSSDKICVVRKFSSLSILEFDCLTSFDLR